MKFMISKEITEKHPDLNIGVVVAKNIDNSGESKEINGLVIEKEKEIISNFNKETLSQEPKIKIWRDTYASFGAKPKKHKCSVENLYRLILEGNQLKHINKIVDLYNYISIKYMVPVGGDDIDKVNGNIMLKFSDGNETFKELNTGEEKKPQPGEVVYADDKEVLCRRWNWRQCEKTKMTLSTKNICLVVEGLTHVTAEELSKITKELTELICKYCGGSTEIFLLGKNKTEVEL